MEEAFTLNFARYLVMLCDNAVMNHKSYTFPLKKQTLVKEKRFIHFETRFIDKEKKQPHCHGGKSQYQYL